MDESLLLCMVLIISMWMCVLVVIMLCVYRVWFLKECFIVGLSWVVVYSGVLMLGSWVMNLV